MKVIGITGGIGAGKTTVLELIRNSCRCFIILADQAAHEVKMKGRQCYYELIELLGEDILGPDGEINKAKMAEKIFSGDNGDLIKKVNEIIHPRVKEYILDLLNEHRKKSDVDYFFIEAALLIEDGYKSICDELWYIYADEDIRVKRLKASRGYSDEKIRNIMAEQNSDKIFRECCDHVIENNGDLELTRRQIEMIIGKSCKV